MDQVSQKSKFQRTKSWGNSASQILTQHLPPNFNWIKTEPDPDWSTDVVTNMCPSNTPIEDGTVPHYPNWSDTQSLSKIVKTVSRIKEEPIAEEFLNKFLHHFLHRFP